MCTAVLADLLPLTLAVCFRLPGAFQCPWLAPSSVRRFSTKNSPPSTICLGGSPSLMLPHQITESSYGSGTPTILSANADVTWTGLSSVPQGASNLHQCETCDICAAGVGTRDPDLKNSEASGECKNLTSPHGKCPHLSIFPPARLCIRYQQC